MAKKHHVPNVRKSEDDLQSRLGATVRNHRKQLGITQEELAWRANMHRTYLADIERGARNITLRSVDNLAKALQLSVEGLLFETRGAGDLYAHQDRIRPWGEILLIEDNPEDIELALRAFRHANILNPLTVLTDGNAASDYLFRNGRFANRPDSAPQLVLLDLGLPGLSGLELLQRMRKHEMTRQVPVVVLTASQSESDRLACTQLGAAEYLVKPVEFGGLARVTSKLDFQWSLIPPTMRVAARPPTGAKRLSRKSGFAPR